MKQVFIITDITRDPAFRMEGPSRLKQVIIVGAHDEAHADRVFRHHFGKSFRAVATCGLECCGSAFGICCFDLDELKPSDFKQRGPFGVLRQRTFIIPEVQIHA